MTDQPTSNRPADDPAGEPRHGDSGQDGSRGPTGTARRKKLPRYLLIGAAAVLIIVGLVVTFTKQAPKDEGPAPVGEVERVSAPLPADSGFRVMETYGQAGSSPESKHTGEDFSAAQGTPVLSVLDGVVVASITEDWVGSNVVVEHAGGAHTLYGHLSAIDAQPGTEVKAGQPLGKVGSTGNSFAPHLHLEYYPAGPVPGRDSEQAQDPIAFLRSKGVQI